MDGEAVQCACCGEMVRPEVPEYFIEIESFRLMAERNLQMPRRGSKEYHSALEKLRPEVQTLYFDNRELYDRGHLWCPNCGNRLPTPRR